MVPMKKICATYVICYSLVITIIVLLPVVSAVSKGVLDLSYSNHWTPTTISSHLQTFISNHVTSSSNHIYSNVIIDISNANLGDHVGLDFLQSLHQSCFANSTTTTFDDCDRQNTTTQIGIDLILHSNRLTPQHVTAFLNKISESSVQSKATSVHNQTNNNITTTTTSDPVTTFWRSLDFGWNLLYNRNTAAASSKKEMKNFHTALQNILVSRNSTIQQLHLSCCGLGPATCRALAKGLWRRFDTIESSIITNNNTNETIMMNHRPAISLFLSNNPDIGDSGTAAIAAALRSITADRKRDTPIFDTLDLSGCDVGDIGVEALALALEDAVAPVMIRRLLLCHNRITDQGALALGRVLHRNVDGSELYIDISNNPSITDRGITNLLSAVEKRCVSNLIVRSCSIHADGAELVGKTLRTIALSANGSNRSLEIDLSGNPLGILRSKSDKGNMYSAGAIKSKASATASAYVSQGLSFLKKGLGSVGVTISPDNEDEDDEKPQPSNNLEESDKGTNMRCGFKSLANAFISYGQDVPTSDTNLGGEKNIVLGLRRTFCDTAGADALAAMIMATREHYHGVNLKLELDLNPVVEDEMINALYGDNDEILSEMADRHNDAMETLRQAQERADTAARALAARRRQAVTSSSTAFDDDDDDDGTEDEFEDYYDEAEHDDGLWDSDDDYDENEDGYDDSEKY